MSDKDRTHFLCVYDTEARMLKLTIRVYDDERMPQPGKTIAYGTAAQLDKIVNDWMAD